jgi:hypothetical protein
MASTECKTSKIEAAVITRDKSSTIPEKCEIFKKPGSASSHSVIMAA